MELFISSFIFFFAVIDPIGSVPVFIAVTRQDTSAIKKKIAYKAVLVAAVVLLFFVVAGEFLLSVIDIPLPAFQIAGGIILFLFALTMIFGESKPEEEKKMMTDPTEKAIFPMAMPSIASPGAMLAAVLLTENDKNTIMDQVYTSASMLFVLLITLFLLLMASRIQRLIGDSGAIIISRVMGLILCSVAVSSILEGIAIYFHIPT